MKKQLTLLTIFIMLISPLAAQNETEEIRFYDGQKTRKIQVKQQENAESQQYGVSAQFFYNTQYYNIYFSDNAIATLKAASEQYSLDFQNRKLSRKDKKAQKKYGMFEARLEWGASRQKMEQFSENVNINLGYAFAQKSPYFLIEVQNVQSQNSNAPPALVYSGQIRLFFTKAQLAELVKLIAAQ